MLTHYFLIGSPPGTQMNRVSWRWYNSGIEWYRTLNIDFSNLANTSGLICTHKRQLIEPKIPVHTRGLTCKRGTTRCTTSIVSTAKTRAPIPTPFIMPAEIRSRRFFNQPIVPPSFKSKPQKQSFFKTERVETDQSRVNKSWLNIHLMFFPFKLEPILCDFSGDTSYSYWYLHLLLLFELICTGNCKGRQLSHAPDREQLVPSATNTILTNCLQDNWQGVNHEPPVSACKGLSYVLFLILKPIHIIDMIYSSWSLHRRSRLPKFETKDTICVWH